MRKVPKLRFKEFSDEWVEKKLGEICSIKTGKKDTKNKIENGIYPFFVRSQNVEKINTYSYDGEAILTAGDGVGVGKVFHYINGKFDFHQRVYKLSDFDQNYGRFIYEIFRKDFRKEVSKYNAKTSVDSIRLEMISNMKVTIPSLQEQEKIADFLSNVDKKLSLTEEKLELFREYKKGVMQKIFSQKLRFKDSEGNVYPEWVEKKLGEIVNINKGQQLNKEFLEEIGDFAVINGGIFPSGYTNNYNTLANTITISEGGNSCGYVNFIKNSFWAGGHCYTLEKKKDINYKYLYHLLKYNEKNIMDLRVGSGLPNIQKNSINNYKIILSNSSREQQKIADFLSSIDTKIENIEKELEGLKEFKKGLLQQMFV